jgi:predicted small lipoprotein YifL
LGLVARRRKQHWYTIGATSHQDYIVMTKQLLACIFALFGFAFLAGCGQKGPLFLPGNPSAVHTEVPQQGGTAEEEEEDEDESEEVQPD